MEMILDFLVDNYIWILIISIFLILVLIGYIADQKIKLKKIKEQKTQGLVSQNVNAPIQEVVQNNNVVPNPIASEPIVNEPVNVENNVDAIETPTFEPINNVPVEEPIVEPVTEPIIEQPATNLVSEPIIEENTQTILDIPDHVIDVNIPVQEETIPESAPIELKPMVEQPVMDNTEIIEEPEIIEELGTLENVVNTWEPEIATQNQEIINETQNKDSI